MRNSLCFAAFAVLLWGVAAGGCNSDGDTGEGETPLGITVKNSSGKGIQFEIELAGASRFIVKDELLEPGKSWKKTEAVEPGSYTIRAFEDKQTGVKMTHNFSLDPRYIPRHIGLNFTGFTQNEGFSTFDAEKGKE